jgi:hypothetical protein
VDAVLLTNSCARGRARPESDLDLLVLAAEGGPVAELEAAWRRELATAAPYAALRQAGRFTEIHLDVHDSRFAPPDHPDDEFPDAFEIALANALVYAAPLWQRRDHLAHLRHAWLPYYDEDLRQRRLAAVRWCCRQHLDHIPAYVARQLYFQALDRLWLAFRCFLQALFIARRAYPIADNKWIREQIEGILGLPDRYPRLPPLFEIARLESPILAAKAHDLGALLAEYLPDIP